MLSCLVDEDSENESAEEENGDRLEQQMGDAGDAAEEVDEKFWEDEDEKDDVSCNRNEIAIWLTEC